MPSPGAADRSLLAALRGPGFVVCRAVLDLAGVGAIASIADAHLARLESLAREHGVHAVGARLPEGTRYQGSAASLGIDVVEGWEWLIGAVAGAIGSVASHYLDGPAAVDVDISWLRRQYPPHLRLPGHAAHALHQDGAFGYDFTGDAPEPVHIAQNRDRHGAEGLLPMLTAWIPLTNAGEDAPGIELIAGPTPALVPLANLDERYANEAWPLAQRARPAMAPGDLLLMAGHNLHRTHATADMTRARTSIELRLVPPAPLPARLAGHRLLPFPEPIRTATLRRPAK